MTVIWLVFLCGLTSCFATKKIDYDLALGIAINYAKIYDMYRPRDLRELPDNMNVSKVLHVPPYKSYVHKIRTSQPGKSVDIYYMFVAKGPQPGSKLCTATVHEFNVAGRFYYVLPYARNLKCEDMDDEEADVTEERLPQGDDASDASYPVQGPSNVAADPGNVPSNTAEWRRNLGAKQQANVQGNIAQTVESQMETAAAEALPGNTSARFDSPTPFETAPTDDEAPLKEKKRKSGKVVMMRKGNSLVPVVVHRAATLEKQNPSQATPTPKNAIPVIQLGRSRDQATTLPNKSSTTPAESSTSSAKTMKKSS